MTFFIHQTVGVLTDPVFIALLALLAGIAFWSCGSVRLGRSILIADLIIMWILATPLTSELVAEWLERDYSPAKRAEEMPTADAVVLLGGGIWAPPAGSDYPYPDLKEPADRAWHAVRLMKAGKAEKIYCTCSDVARSTPPFLMEMGIPETAIVPLGGPRNTEEEARSYNEVLKGKKILLVTSATHMKRATRIFAKFAPDLKVIPAATDYAYIEPPVREFDIRRYLPSVNAYSGFSVLQHELLGLLRYAF